ncbi:hypothetical protein E5288_WYG015086 [Bos mutus]|uniref:Uncharacterized protein n=1 Tax=Bos mutus TaxID=72004 RepID=A0A6B0RIB5_9CETA|nr:hypothetical protein [Bos mutus]
MKFAREDALVDTGVKMHLEIYLCKFDNKTELEVLNDHHGWNYDQRRNPSFELKRRCNPAGCEVDFSHIKLGFEVPERHIQALMDNTKKMRSIKSSNTHLSFLLIMEFIKQNNGDLWLFYNDSRSDIQEKKRLCAYPGVSLEKKA